MKKRTRRSDPRGMPVRSLVGSDYVAMVRLSTKDNRTVADVGQTCENVPVVSLEWLARAGKIKKASVVTPDPEA